MRRGGDVNTASIWISLMQPRCWILGRLALSLSPTSATLSHLMLSHAYTGLVAGCDCITLALTAAGLSFINAFFSTA